MNGRAAHFLVGPPPGNVSPTFTAGVNLVMCGNSTLGACIATPVTGPRPNNVEALVSFNFRF